MTAAAGGADAVLAAAREAGERLAARAAAVGAPTVRLAAGDGGEEAALDVAQMIVLGVMEEVVNGMGEGGEGG